MTKYKRETGSDKPWLAIQYSDGNIWMFTFEVCQICLDRRELDEKPYRVAKERYSFAGSFADDYFPRGYGRYCDMCWQESGYADKYDELQKRDATDHCTELSPEDCDQDRRPFGYGNGYYGGMMDPDDY